MRRAGLAVVVALALAGGASAELVAPRVQDGELAVAPDGRPFVAYVRGSVLRIVARTPAGRWRAARSAALAPGANLVAFVVGSSGPVALVLSADQRTLVLVSAHRKVQLAAGLPAGSSLGWPGLTLDGRGLPVVAYTRWRHATRESVLVLARSDARGRFRSQYVTSEGFPRSFVAPPAAPVLVRGRVHVIESYGFDGTVGTIEWRPQRRTWTGQVLDGGVGDYPIGPLLAVTGAGGTVYAAWTQALLGTGESPITLATRGKRIDSDFVLDRAVTTGLAATRAGPEIAADEWVGADELGLGGNSVSWAGVLVGHGRTIELDGWLGDVAAAPRGARDVLVARPGGLFWFRAPRPLQTLVSIDAEPTSGNGVRVGGQVRGGTGGTIAVYRERPGSPRTLAGVASLSRDGSYSMVDRPPARPLLYRAVYVPRASGIPFAALLRQPVH
jgi:hypothetical protein